MLIGNKSDLDNLRAIREEEGEKFARHNKMLFLETSALDGANIEEAFH